MLAAEPGRRLPRYGLSSFPSGAQGRTAFGEAHKGGYLTCNLVALVRAHGSRTPRWSVRPSGLVPEFGPTTIHEILELCPDGVIQRRLLVLLELLRHDVRGPGGRILAA